MPTMRNAAPAILVARSSSSLSGGAIAGAVIGSLAAVGLILFCALPFIIRAWRLRHVPDGDPLQAEIGQGTGGLVTPQFSYDGALQKGHAHTSQPPQLESQEKHHAQDDYHRQHSPTDPQHGTILPPGVTSQQGLPSPISTPPPNVGTYEEAALADLRADSQASTSGAGRAGKPHWWSRGGSVGTIDKTVSRDMSIDSYTSSSRQPTSFMNDGITQEPGQLDQELPHRHASLARLVQGNSRTSRQSSTQSRTIPRATDLDGPEAFVQAGSSTVPTLEPVDTEARGAAYEYYHGVIDMPDSYTFSPTPAPTNQRSQSTTAPSSPTHGQFLLGPVPTSISDEPDVISPSSDKTITPTYVGRFFPPKAASLNKSSSPLQRMDTLPLQDIVADIPSPPHQPTSGPSVNPMDIMKPSNEAEMSWARDQEILKIESSPPPPLGLPSPPAAELEQYHETRTAPEVDYSPSGQVDGLPTPEHQLQTAGALPEIEVNGQDANMEYIEEMDMDNMVDMSDYSTPPPSSGPSTENTPDTRLTESSFPGSPSSPPFPVAMSHSPMDSQSPESFGCETCGRVFDQVHKLNHHKRYHERPHPCSYPNCDMRFGTKTHLVRHINDKHQKTRKIYCVVPDCPYSRLGGKYFPRKDNWKRHMLNKHSIVHEGEPGPEYMEDVMADS